jgi:hypothetical protein
MSERDQSVQRRNLINLLAVAALLALSCVAIFDQPGTAAGDTRSPGRSASTTSSPTSSPTAAPTATPIKPPSKPPTTTPTTSSHSATRPSGSAPSAQHRVTALESARAVQQIIAAEPAGAVSVAALNTQTGARFVAGATGGVWTASVYKLLVLETLLWQHQQSGTGLSADEAAKAQAAIENSDNVAGYDLFDAIGGRGGLTAGIAALGLHHTTAGISDPTFTVTSATDQLKVLQNLISPNSPLNSESRAYIRNLMGHVESDQRWGVGVTADAGTTFDNKNGWLEVDNENAPTEDDEDLWITCSVGIVSVDGQQVLMAVLTRHQADLATGINLVERLARTMVPTVAQ